MTRNGPLSDDFLQQMRTSWDEYRESRAQDDPEAERTGTTQGTLFRLNITSWMGERVGPLLDEIERLRSLEGTDA